MAERVVVKQGSTTTEFIYGDYQDWNNPLNKIEAYYAGKMTERRNGTAVRDLTTVETETGSVYVVMPVPASVRAAITPGQPAPPADAAPHRSHGGAPVEGSHPATGQREARPDRQLGRRWHELALRQSPLRSDAARRLQPAVNQTMDFEFEAPSRFGPNRPLYKPEHWDKVIALDMWTNKEDPVMTCQPLGIPRQGPPRRIIQSANDIVFFYTQYADGGGGQAEFRIMPTDGRKHDRAMRETRYMGYTVGSWEGDTLVLDSHRVQRLDLACARRLLPLRRDARGRALHASGQRDPVRGDGRGSGGARGAIRDDAANPARQRECQRGAPAGAR